MPTREPRFALRLFESGSEGRAYLLKDRLRSRDDLVNAIEAVARGDSVVDPKVVETLVEARRRQLQSPLRELTPREIEVLAQIPRDAATPQSQSGSTSPNAPSRNTSPGSS